jgi:hypothetical protein
VIRSIDFYDELAKWTAIEGIETLAPQRVQRVKGSSNDLSFLERKI